jgi:hypothetical protein
MICLVSPASLARRDACRWHFGDRRYRGESGEGSAWHSKTRASPPHSCAVRCPVRLDLDPSSTADQWTLNSWETRACRCRRSRKSPRAATWASSKTTTSTVITTLLAPENCYCYCCRRCHCHCYCHCWHVDHVDRFDHSGDQSRARSRVNEMTRRWRYARVRVRRVCASGRVLRATAACSVCAKLH